MPLLSGLSKDELQELMDNEDKINEIVCDQEKVRKIKLDIELIQAENRSLADHTIEKEPLLENLRKTVETKYENIHQLKEIFQVSQAKLESLQKNVNLEAMLNVLQAKCAMSEEKSEELAEQYCAGSMAVAEFIEQFKERKTEAHLRRIKSDKMRELVIQAQRHQVINPSPVSNHSYSPQQPRECPALNNQPAYPGQQNAAGGSYGSGSFNMPAYPPQQQSYKWG